MRSKTIVPTAVACLLSFTFAAPAMADDEEEKKGRNCIQTRTLKGTAVVDDRNVLFVRKGNRVYHNELPEACKDLGKYKNFSYTTTAGSLCRQDIIHVMDGSGRESRTCQLGRFYEITTEELQALVAASQARAAAGDESADESGDQEN